MLEAEYWSTGLRVAGIDEAGRGAWAGPVVAGAVILPPGNYPFRDSKAFPAKEREALYQYLTEVALAYGVGFAGVKEISHYGIVGATHKAALRAIAALNPAPEQLITDYLFLKTHLPIVALAKAENLSPSVGAASILAKVTRDWVMGRIALRYPGYGLERHKGYGTRDHARALSRLGPSPVHRQTFRPVAGLNLPDPR